MILSAGDCHATVDQRLAKIKKIFSLGKEDAIVQEVVRLVGGFRPGSCRFTNSAYRDLHAR